MTNYSNEARIVKLLSELRNSTSAYSSGKPYIKFLTLFGDGSGNNNFNGNYSGGVIQPYFRVPAGYNYDVHTVNITIVDATNFTQTEYGGAIALTNGVTFWINTGGVDVPLLGGQVLKQNLDWYKINTDNTFTNFAGNGGILTVDVLIKEEYGIPLTLSSSTSDLFKVKLNDDFTGLAYHSFNLRGVLYQPEV